MQQLGLHALLSLFIYFVTTALAFQAIKCLDLSKLFKIKKIFEEQILDIFLALGLGYLVGQFFIAFMDYYLTLTNLFNN